MPKIIFSLTGLLLALSLSHAANADSLRCGTNLVEVGANKAELIEKCGPPYATDSYCRNEYVQGNFGYQAVCHKIDLWTYNLGIGKFLMNVEIEEGKISNITHGDRVD